jgi:hypothetical protein
MQSSECRSGRKAYITGWSSECLWKIVRTVKGKQPSGSWRSSEPGRQTNYKLQTYPHRGRFRKLYVQLSRQALHCYRIFIFTPEVPSSVKRNPDSLHPGLLYQALIRFSKKMLKPCTYFVRFLFSKHSKDF